MWRQVKQLRDAQRPLLLLGHGIRLAGAVDLTDPLLDHLGIPAIVSWAGKDMSDHPLIYGSAGVYGGRAANHIVQQADFILCIGTRLAIPQTGYDITKFAPDAKIVVVDIDPEEAHKFMEHERFTGIVADAKEFMLGLMEPYPIDGFNHDWMGYIYDTVERFPVIEECHADPPGFISPYLFLKRLEQHLKPDAVIVTDSGGALLCSHQVMTLKPPQRLITTTGLGEMGFGLPGAIGASFARNKGEVICLNTDGSMMLNLQELQTIAHHNLPIKIIVFSNDGYGMIRHSQKAMGLAKTGSDREGGVSCPDFRAIGNAFGIPSMLTLEGAADCLPWLMRCKGPALLEVHCSPEQQYLPKLMGSPGFSPALDEISPLLVRA
jgi:acetolactate synthase-1/2/3 large subunit